MLRITIARCAVLASSAPPRLLGLALPRNFIIARPVPGDQPGTAVTASPRRRAD